MNRVLADEALRAYRTTGLRPDFQHLWLATHAGGRLISAMPLVVLAIARGRQPLEVAAAIYDHGLATLGAELGLSRAYVNGYRAGWFSDAITPEEAAVHDGHRQGEVTRGYQDGLAARVACLQTENFTPTTEREP